MRPSLKDLEYLGVLPTRIFKALWRDNQKSRAELVRELGCPRSTIYDNIVKLEKRKIVERKAINNGKQGRSIVYWFLTDYGKSLMGSSIPDWLH